MSKRKAEDFNLEFGESGERPAKFNLYQKKHTLDSDEEDSDGEERYNVMSENEIVGEEDGVSQMEGGVKFTPFNMKEELEEGHFDLEGHFQWDKSKEIKDNWLDNIDWVKVKVDKKYVDKRNSGVGSSSDSEDDQSVVFNDFKIYKKILEFMQPGETISKTLQRLGKKSAMLSSAERWRRKKAGIVDESSELITKLTALTNEILTKTGYMGIYEETYEVIEEKLRKYEQTKSATVALDMYSDDFGTQEKNKLSSEKNQEVDIACVSREQLEKGRCNDIQWEFKWKQDGTEIYGPYSTEQMLNWVEEGYFKDGVFVRKVGEDERFYSSNRIDFDLYI